MRFVRIRGQAAASTARSGSAAAGTPAPAGGRSEHPPVDAGARGCRTHASFEAAAWPLGAEGNRQPAGENRRQRWLRKRSSLELFDGREHPTQGFMRAVNGSAKWQYRWRLRPSRETPRVSTHRRESATDNGLTGQVDSVNNMYGRESIPHTPGGHRTDRSDLRCVATITKTFCWISFVDCRHCNRWRSRSCPYRIIYWFLGMCFGVRTKMADYCRLCSASGTSCLQPHFQNWCRQSDCASQPGGDISVDAQRKERNNCRRQKPEARWL